MNRGVTSTHRMCAYRYRLCAALDALRADLMRNSRLVSVALSDETSIFIARSVLFMLASQAAHAPDERSLLRIDEQLLLARAGRNRVDGRENALVCQGRGRA